MPSSASFCLPPSFTCKLFACEGCPVNVSNQVKNAIVKRLEEANAFVCVLGYSNAIQVRYTPPKEPSRRAFFERFLAPSAFRSDAPQDPMGYLKKALKASLQKAQILNMPLSFIHLNKAETGGTFPAFLPTSK